MKPKKRSPVWPYLGILACLFALSVTAPRAWDRMARHESLQQMLESRKARAVDSQPGPEPLEQFEDSELTARETVELAAEAPAVVDAPVVPPAPELTLEVSQTLEVVHRPDSAAEDRPDMEVPLDEPPAEPQAEESHAVEADTLPGWPVPRALITQLNRLAQDDSRAVWADRAAELVRELCAVGGHREEVSRIVKQLRELAEPDAAATMVDSPLESQAARTRYALRRWLEVWEHAALLPETATSVLTSAEPPESLRVCLAEVDALTRKGKSGAAWRQYLQLKTLNGLAREGSEDERRAAARKVLDQLESFRLSRSQRKFVNEGPLAALQSELRVWAAAPVMPAQLLAHLEAYEYSGLTSDARKVADDFRGLSWSSPAEAEEISQSLGTHYRNANLRIALAGPLLNRMVPQPPKMENEVQDTVVNVPVYGRSTTYTKLSVRLVPDPRRIRIGLEANGLVDSDTRSTSGPATFYNEGRSTFLVRKLFVIGPQGLSVWPAIAEAENSYTYLISLETDFDGVPLVGPLVRGVARNKHEEARGDARAEVEYKVATRARDQLDAEIRPLLTESAQRFEKEQLATLKRLGMEMTPLGLATTEDRIVARVRLGSAEQLGAHTPRPRAPADSWLSMQLHQSALNNVLEKLDLGGRKFTMPELFAWLAEKLGRPQLSHQADLPDDVQITFAKENGVRLRCEDGRVEVVFAIAELTQGRHRWRDFTVRTHYRPEARDLDPRFVRDTTIFLDGKSLRGKPQVLLRTIFSKVLSPNRELSLLSEKITSDPRIKDLQITQFMVEDGWIGLAYSPHRPSGTMAKRPK
jgi:hypothetical protein